MQQTQSWSSILVVLAALLLNQVTISQCYSHFTLKSSKTNGLPIDPAMEKIQPRTIDCGDALQRPSKKDLNERKLRRRLGGSIDERFLSIMEPLHSSDTFVRQVSLRGISTSEKNLLRQIIRNETSPKMGKPSPFIERYMMKWLIQKSDCPVEYTWKDLGFCYWPRWISLGRCVNKQCSWPLGMSCAASELAPVYLLRWNCKKRGGKKARRGTDSERVSCRWVKFRYPIIHQCKCKCQEKRENGHETSSELLSPGLLERIAGN